MPRLMYPFSLAIPTGTQSNPEPANFVDYEAPCPACGHDAPWRSSTANRETSYGETLIITNVRIDCACDAA